MMPVRSWNESTGMTLPPPIPAWRKGVRAIFTIEEQT